MPTGCYSITASKLAKDTGFSKSLHNTSYGTIVCMALKMDFYTVVQNYFYYYFLFTFLFTLRARLPVLGPFFAGGAYGSNT